MHGVRFRVGVHEPITEEGTALSEKIQLRRYDEEMAISVAGDVLFQTPRLLLGLEPAVF